MDTKKASDMKINKDEPIRVLIYGEAGCGKTKLVGSFPKPMLVYDFDQKLKPIYGIEGIDVISYTVSEVEDYSTVFNQFKRDWKEGKNTEKYKTLVVDGITSLDLINLRHFTKESGKDPLAGATLPVYKDQSGWYSHFFTSMKDITSVHRKNLIVTAHIHYIVDEESGVHSMQPLITGKSILYRLPALFEEVWFMEMKGGETTERILYYKKYKKAVATSALLEGDGKIVLPEVKRGEDYNAYDLIMEHAKKGA